MTSEVRNRRSLWNLAAGGRGVELYPQRSQHPLLLKEKWLPPGDAGKWGVLAPALGATCQGGRLSRRPPPPPPPGLTAPPSPGERGAHPFTASEFEPRAGGPQRTASTRRGWHPGKSPGKGAAHPPGHQPDLGCPSIQGRKAALGLMTACRVDGASLAGPPCLSGEET